MGIIELITSEALAEGKRAGFAEGENLGLSKGKTEGKAEGKLEGFQEGERRKMLQTIQKLIANTDFGNEQIALLTDGTPELVQTIRERLAEGNREIEDLMKIEL